MSSTSHPAWRRATLFIAIGTALSGASFVSARTVSAGQTLVVDGEKVPTESFSVLPDGTLRLINGASAGDVEVQKGVVEIMGSSVSSTSTSAMSVKNGATLSVTDGVLMSTATGERSSGLVLTFITGEGADLAPSATLTRTTVGGGNYAATISSAGTLDADASTFTSRNTTSAGIGLFGGSVNLTGQSSVTGQAAGIQIAREARADPLNARSLTVDHSTVKGVVGPAILVTTLDDPLKPIPTSADITLRNGAVLEGGNGVAFDLRDRTTSHIDIGSSDIAGDITMTSGATADITLRDAATFTGAANGNVAFALNSGTRWTLGGSSSIASLATDGGTVALGQADAATFHDLRVNGPLSGSGGTMLFNTVLDSGGPLTSQQTDRLLVEGDVTTTAPILITVRGRGEGALTDTNRDGVVDSNEGISLVQVGGASRRDAFELAGGYVAAGPWQYKLYAFGPGEVDPAQKALQGSDFNWDYRLGNSYVCEKECEPENPGEPENPDVPLDPELPPPGPEPVVRPEVVPQVPAYVSAPAALLTYGDMLNDGLHQRLGDIRKGESNDPVGTEMFARYLGGQLRYSSNLSFKQFGYDFDQQVNALQVGAGIIALDGDNGSLRAGWALDHGTTRISPNARDGQSSSKYTANGGSAWITWQHGDGLWVDGVVSGTRYVGDVSTAMRGDEVARIRATGRVISVEAGLPIALGADWTLEPQLQLKHQSMNFRDFRDKDGLDVHLGKASQASQRLGVQLGWSANPAFAAYGRLDLIHSGNGDPSVDVSSVDWDMGARFKSGRVGNAVRAAAGATGQLGRHVQVYGEGTWQHFTGNYGMRGWAANLGVRVTL